MSMERKKEYGIAKVTKEESEKNLEENLTFDFLVSHLWSDRQYKGSEEFPSTDKMVIV